MIEEAYIRSRLKNVYANLDAGITIIVTLITLGR